MIETPIADTDRMKHNTPDDRLISTGRAAQELGVTSQTVRRWIDEGKLPAVRSHTGRYLVRVADVDQLRPRPLERA